MEGRDDVRNVQGFVQECIFDCDECVICLDHPPTSVFYPCRHRCCCTSCGELVEKSKMTCPLCRARISEVLVFEGNILPSSAIGPDEIEVFKRERREDYIKQLRAPVAKDAGFKGKGKMARSVAREVGSELENRQRETAGTERVTAKPSCIQFTEQPAEDAQPADADNLRNLRIDYKCGRSKRQELHALITLDEAREGLLECLSGDKVTLLDVATYYPEYYWLIKYHLSDSGQSITDYLGNDMNVLQKKR